MLRVIEALQTNLWLWVFGKLLGFVGKPSLSGFWGYPGYCAQPRYAPVTTGIRVWQRWGGPGPIEYPAYSRVIHVEP